MNRAGSDAQGGGGRPRVDPALCGARPALEPRRPDHPDLVRLRPRAPTRSTGRKALAVGEVQSLDSHARRAWTPPTDPPPPPPLPGVLPRTPSLRSRPQHSPALSREGAQGRGGRGSPCVDEARQTRRSRGRGSTSPATTRGAPSSARGAPSRGVGGVGPDSASRATKNFIIEPLLSAPPAESVRVGRDRVSTPSVSSRPSATKQKQDPAEPRVLCLSLKSRGQRSRPYSPQGRPPSQTRRVTPGSSTIPTRVE